jgi:hypothetical protein
MRSWKRHILGIHRSDAEQGVALARPLGEPPWTGYERVNLWRVGTRHARRTKFQVGVTPPGLEEVVPLERPLPTAAMLGVVVDTIAYRNDQTFFSLGDLREGSIYRPGSTGHVTVREFYADACD